MASRVTVNITARDMTRGELQRMRRNFGHLGQDIDRAVGARTRNNFARLSQSASQARRDLNAMRGSIPDDEFRRLDDAIRNAQRRLGRGFNNVGDRAFRKILRDLRTVQQGFNDLDRSGVIRVRTDLSALRRADAQLAAWRRTQSRNAVRVPVRPDVDRHSFRRTLVRTLTAPFRVAGSTLGGILSDGIGQGIIGGFQAAGPIAKAVFVSILVGILSVLGAALSGIIVTALGLAFVGVSGWSAATSKEVKEQWKETLGSLKENFKEVGEPMIPVLERALKKLQELGDKITPVFKKAIDDATPATNAFIDKLFEGVERMGKAMFKPIMEAWEVFAPVFGQALSDAMEMWGESFADMAKLVREHSVEIEMAIRVVFKVIDLLIDAVTFLGEVWVWNMQTMGDAMGAIIQYAVSPLVRAVFEGVEAMLGAFSHFADFLPGPLGDALKTAKEHFGDFKEDVYAKIDGMQAKTYGFDEALDRLNKERILKANITGWKRDLEAAKEKLKSVPKEKKSKLKGEIADLKRKIEEAQRWLNDIPYNRTVHIWVKSHYDNQVADYFRASGGNIGAAATGGNRGNKVMVGEHGPEIVDLPAGSHVRSNSDTRRYLAQQSAGPQPVIRIEAAHDDVSQFLLRILRNSIRSEGGNVQFVLGQQGV
jgi:gas vesicle protein